MAKQASVANSVKSLQAMEKAKNAHVIELDSMKAMAELGGGAVRNDNGAECALFAAAIIDNPELRKANAAGYSSAKGYGYSNGFYGTFEEGDNKVPSYDDITGIVTQPLFFEAPEFSTKAEEKKCLKDYWAQYKWYIIVLLTIVAAIVALKKL